ncbi:hypothetical protein U8C36_20640 (plasmid) [Sinorhizobium medicae]|uniref:hypothetical protein n=1 Tax=Sinorhizobium medicae TaxID=110321 RepID=UPI002AF6B8BA|nr:hypothetical protein [Sinorhizobium medicae]WQO54805.1 hypothetical protein U8C36_20640 [Sinorhizobium medicae]
MQTELRLLIDMTEAANDERMIKSAVLSFANAHGFEHFAYLQTQGDDVQTFMRGGNQGEIQRQSG